MPILVVEVDVGYHVSVPEPEAVSVLEFPEQPFKLEAAVVFTGLGGGAQS